MEIDNNWQEVFLKAERIILDETSTQDAIAQAIASVDALNMPEASVTIRRTLYHEMVHKRHLG
jgi:hypothetical protein